MPVSKATANADLDRAYGSGGVIYAALSTVAPNYSGNGNQGTITEPTVNQYANYSRVPIANTVSNWPPAANGSKTNGSIIVFPLSAGGTMSPAIVQYLCFLTTNDSTYTLIDALPLPTGTLVVGDNALLFPISSVQIGES